MRRERWYFSYSRWRRREHVHIRESHAGIGSSQTGTLLSEQRTPIARPQTRTRGENHIAHLKFLELLTNLQPAVVLLAFQVAVDAGLGIAESENGTRYITHAFQTLLRTTLRRLQKKKDNPNKSQEQ
jgi:hypothetical protein